MSGPVLIRLQYCRDLASDLKGPYDPIHSSTVCQTEYMALLFLVHLQLSQDPADVDKYPGVV